MAQRPFTVEEMNAYARAWQQELRRRQMEKFKRTQLKQAQDDAYWEFVMGGVIY